MLFFFEKPESASTGHSALPDVRSFLCDSSVRFMEGPGSILQIKSNHSFMVQWKMMENCCCLLLGNCWREDDSQLDDRVVFGNGGIRTYNYDMQGGPLLVINGAITPISRLING